MNITLTYCTRKVDYFLECIRSRSDGDYFSTGNRTRVKVYLILYTLLLFIKKKSYILCILSNYFKLRFFSHQHYQSFGPFLHSIVGITQLIGKSLNSFVLHTNAIDKRNRYRTEINIVFFPRLCTNFQI
uniref:Uncharacterized protein n=1 Tax=Cacopsylla melanoneura TaxID=428564 RepID=A0A8D9DSH6_9HEMI